MDTQVTVIVDHYIKHQSLDSTKTTRSQMLMIPIIFFQY